MSDAQAVKLATNWVAVRRQVRTRLIALARANWATQVSLASPHWASNELRKLYETPGDLSDERLLHLAQARNHE